MSPPSPGHLADNGGETDAVPGSSDGLLRDGPRGEKLPPSPCGLVRYLYLPFPLYFD